MDLVAKLPEMPDLSLATLRANAERLRSTGTPAQKTAAEALLPAIGAELATRHAAKLANAPVKARAPAKTPTVRKTPAKRVAKPRTVKAESDDEAGSHDEAADDE